MAKILLVEDDNNLREIFEMRVQAEGYDTVTAGDGEEGLVVAMKEKPDLIVADVMMPKLSGFEMLETLRASPEMANTKVIMMTALGQADDQARGEKLGVVKYLVKSQVTLEDFARVIKEVLSPGDESGVSTESNKDSADDNKQEDSSSKNNNNESEKSMPEDTTPSTNPSEPTADSGLGAPTPAADPVAPVADDSAAANPISGDAPAADPAAPAAVDGQQTSAEEQNSVNDQIDSFVSSAPAADPAAAPAGDGATPTEHTDLPVADPPAGDGNSGGPVADPSAPPAPPSGL